jgi:glucokinase
MHITGIDIGGSHITVGLVSSDDLSMISRHIIRKRIESHADAEVIITDWCNAIRECWYANKVDKAPLAFAMPGPFDYANGICLIKGFGKYEKLYKTDIRKAFSQRLNIDPKEILFRNDAEAFLAGELKTGAAKGFNHAIGLTLGTGMGTAKSHHNVTEDAEMSFKIFVDGASIEEFISTRGLLRNYAALTGAQLKDVKALSDLYPIDLSAQKSFDLFAEKLAYLLQRFIIEEQPEVIVIGGNIANAWDLFMPAVIQFLMPQLNYMPIIKKAVLGEEAAIIGAAAMFQ